MRVLITTFGSLGDIYPYLAIAEKLVIHGVKVSFATNFQHRSLIESRGHAFHLLRPEFHPDLACFRKLMNERNGGRFLLREVLFPAIGDSYADTLTAIPGHDLLVTHMITFGGPLAAKTTGIPWISTVLAPITFLSHQDPPVLATVLIGLRRRAPSLTRIVNRLAKNHASQWCQPIQRFQSELGLNDTGSPLFEGQHSPSKILALFSKHFAAPQPDWPAQTTATGFPLRPPADLPESIQRFLESGPAPIVFTLGSSAVHTAGNFFDTARRLGRRAILLAGPQAADIPSTPNLLVVDYAPHSAVFPYATAIVHQGGVGTTSEALRSGRPSLIMPFAYDQPDNAARCERLGVARVISRTALTVKRLERELEELAVPSYTNAATRLAAHIREEDGAATAASAIVNALS